MKTADDWLMCGRVYFNSSVDGEIILFHITKPKAAATVSCDHMLHVLAVREIRVEC